MISSSVENRSLLYENIIIRNKSAEIFQEWFQLFADGFVPAVLPHREKGRATGTWFSGGMDSVRLMVGLDDLEGLLQPK